MIGNRRIRILKKPGRWTPNPALAPLVRRQLIHLLAYAAAMSVSAASLASAAIPSDARKVIQQVHKASSNGDFAMLRQLMVQEFQWSFGGDLNAEQAIEVWKSEGKYLKNMKRVTAQQCGFLTPELIECPAKAGTRYRAGFERTPVGWRMHYFVEGD